MSRSIFIAAGLALTVILPAVSAQAQAPRTFVSAAGSDSNPCSFAAPCRHFQAAVNATSAGGEVDALDPAGYGPITITQAITIEGQRWSYIAPPSGGAAITINAGSNDQINIRGVSLNGVGISGSTAGIQFNSGATLSVEDCVIRHFTGDGIDFFTSAAGSLSVTNSSVANNGAHGVSIAPTGTGTATVMFNRVELNSNALDGLAILGTNSNNSVTATVTDSVFFHNNSVGIEVNNCGAPAACLVGVPKNIMITNTRIVSNGVGVQSFGLAIFVYLSKSTVTFNSSTCVNGSHVWSWGDDNIFGVGCLSPLPIIPLN